MVNDHLLLYERFVAFDADAVGWTIRSIWWAIEQMSSMRRTMICMKPSFTLSLANDGWYSSLLAVSLSCRQNNFLLLWSTAERPLSISFNIYVKLPMSFDAIRKFEVDLGKHKQKHREKRAKNEGNVYSMQQPWMSLKWKKNFLEDITFLNKLQGLACAGDGIERVIVFYLINVICWSDAERMEVDIKEVAVTENM